MGSLICRHHLTWDIDPSIITSAQCHKMRTAASSGQGVMGPSLVLLLTFINIASAEIIKPWKEWLCNYCAMGAPETSEECGTPILCMFYGLLLLIIMFTIYTTIKGTRE